MSAPGRTLHGGVLLRLLASRVRVAYVGGVVFFLYCVGQFYHRDTGFSSLISIGDIVKWRVMEFEAEQEALRDYIKTA